MQYTYSGTLKGDCLNELVNHASSWAARREWGIRPLQFTLSSGNLIALPDATGAVKPPEKLQDVACAGVVFLPHFFSDFVWMIFEKKSGRLVSGDFNAFFNTGAVPLKIDLVKGAITRPQTAGVKTHIEIGEVLNEVFRRFIDGKILCDTEDESEPQLQEAFDKTIEDYREVYLAREGAYGEFSLAGLDFFFDSGREGLRSDQEFFRELSNAIELTAKELSSKNLPVEPELADLDHLDDLATAFESRPENVPQEREDFVAAVGGYWGHLLVQRFKGDWIQREDEIAVANLGDTGLLVNPFHLVSERLTWGAPLNFQAQYEILEAWIERLVRWKKEAE